LPREWLFVRRVRDGRKRLVLPDGGLTLHSYGYVENVAHALLLAVDQPEASCGNIYNVADEQVLSLRQVAEIIGEALGHQWDIINMPYELAPCARPFVMQPLSTHRVQDVSRLRADLGYRDKVPPAQALALTARWLLAHPPAPGGAEEMVLQDPFDYAAEDRLIDAWASAGRGPAAGDFRARAAIQHVVQRAGRARAQQGRLRGLSRGETWDHSRVLPSSKSSAWAGAVRRHAAGPTWAPP